MRTIIIEKNLLMTSFPYCYLLFLAWWHLNILLIVLTCLDTEELFPIPSSTTFFTDMHHILKVMSVGNVRSACHHRLRFLEEVMKSLVPPSLFPCFKSSTFCLARFSSPVCYWHLNATQKFRLHLLVNADREFLAQKSAPHRDLYNIRKVDTHVHHSACMNQKQLLRFIKSKLRKEPDEVEPS